MVEERGYLMSTQQADREAIGTWLCPDGTVAFRVPALKGDRRWTEIARWTQATDAVALVEPKADWSEGRSDTFADLLNLIRETIGPQVFSPDHAVEQFQDLIRRIKCAANDKEKVQLYDSAMRMRNA